MVRVEVRVVGVEAAEQSVAAEEVVVARAEAVVRTVAEPQVEARERVLHFEVPSPKTDYWFGVQVELLLHRHIQHAFELSGSAFV